MSDPDGQTTVETQYDSNGRALKTSNPKRSSESTYWEQYSYDGLSRIKQVTRTDSSLAYTYYGAAVTSGAGGTDIAALLFVLRGGLSRAYRR